jgi:hypothetical protein
MTMRPLLVLLVLALLGLGLVACAGSGASHSPGATTVVKKDRDDDSDNNDDDNPFLYYGHAPSAAERQQLVALVSAYYAAAASEDGAKACRLLIPFMAESVVEDIGHNPGLSGKTCATVMAKLFKSQHTLLAGENASLKFYAVRVGPRRALTILSFANLPEVRVLDERLDSNGKWRVLQLLDGFLE